MTKEKFIADANIGLRILVGNKDIEAASTPELKERQQQIVQDTLTLIRKVAEGKITLKFPDAVVEEMVFVLQKIYGLDRAEISSKILALIEAENVESSETIRETLRQYATVSLDLVDIKLSVESAEQNIPVLTWDKGFSKLSNCEYYAPSDVI
ncbi:hypothetical protein [Cohnella sp. GCM10027633]|uniref:hypothetical protein n=1 Tax=unclassified Cohnella TaxID=2636738 RepID=UPI0036416E6F